MVYELWFKGYYIGDKENLIIKKQHMGRFNEDDFIIYLKRFILKNKLSLNQFKSYIIVSFENDLSEELHNYKSLFDCHNHLKIEPCSKFASLNCEPLNRSVYEQLIKHYRITDESDIKYSVCVLVNNVMNRYR